MKILVTGRDGQLARSLERKVGQRPGFDLAFLGRPELDFEVPGSAADAIRGAAPDLVVNAAAYTQVDEAEDEPDRAMRINADAATEVAEAACAVGAPVIQLSTDYVFDGSASEPYDEAVTPNPQGAYGRSKLIGEEGVRAANPDHLIVRTSWVYSPFGRNFVKTMLTLSRNHDQLSVVDDQVGCPTSALDLADAILLFAERWGSGERTGLGRTYHLCGSGRCSWAEFAAEIFRVSGRLGGPVAEVRPIPTAQFPTRARRPSWSVLDSSAFRRDFGMEMPDWRASVAQVVLELVRTGA